MNRYQRNGILTTEEQQKVKQSSVAVIGCGGLGGYVIEMLARVGIGKLTVVDGDVFDESNMNRQLLCVMDSLGKSKAVIASERIKMIDPSIQVNAVCVFLNQNNATEIMNGHDIIIDALDSNLSRRILFQACKEMSIPCIYGAIAGWYGQVSTVFTEDTKFNDYLLGLKDKGIETDIGNPSFLPPCIASYQVSQALKVLMGKGGVLRDKILYIDMLENEFQILQL